MVQKSGIHQLRLVVYPIIYRVIYIPGAVGFLPSTVWETSRSSNWWLNYQLGDFLQCGGIKAGRFFPNSTNLEYRKTPFLSGIQLSCKDVQRIYQSQLDDS